MSMLSIFRKGDVAKSGTEPQSKLATALYGPVATRPAPPPAVRTVPAPAVADVAVAKLVLGIDATASREAAWGTATALTDGALSALPGRLEVAIAVHGGGRVHTFTPFVQDVNMLRDLAASLRCKLGYTCMLGILRRVLECKGVSTVVYVGDAFEENPKEARQVACLLAARNIRVIILHDTTVQPTWLSSGVGCDPEPVFAEMAAITNGCVLSFDASALPQLRDLLSAVAVLTVGGTSMLAAKQEEMPAARLLLEHLKGPNK